MYGEVGAPAGFPSDGGHFVLPKGRKWKGRARFEWDESYNGGQAITGFGPYVLELGDKLEFAVAEVIGYGGTPGKICLGGQRKTQFFPVRDWNRKVVLNGKVMTEHYLDDFGYPDYINSKVITVNQVAHKAHEAYLGEKIPYDPVRMGPAKTERFPTGMIFPEDNPRPSENPNKYKIPVPVPAPVINVENTATATVKITWNRAVESFTHPRLMGKLAKFYVFRADFASGPFTLLDSVEVGDVNEDNMYEYEDTDQTFKLGETKYYAVTSVDEHGNQSGRTNFTKHTKNVASVEKLTKVYAVPNPFIKESGFEGAGQKNAIGFYGLPERATIRIYSFSGQLVETIEHDARVFSTPWFQVTRNNQDIASGVYFYVVTTPSGEKATGKLLIMK
ncbi:MAG: T9SS C-terminal target domain-containing protein [Calditrichaeota bacterium]|nr:MAG: T9SS C-terminal target domain-containing protein [Calditrichota bacterium]